MMPVTPFWVFVVGCWEFNREVYVRTVSFRTLYRVVALGAILMVVSQPWAFARKGQRISVGDDPSLKEGSPQLVLVELSDFQ